MITRPARRRRSAIRAQPIRPPAPPASTVKATLVRRELPRRDRASNPSEPLSSKADSSLVHVGSAALWGVGIKLLW